VLALKPDLILDVGSTSATYVSLATRVQEQTGIPYALLDGRFDAIAATYRLLGKLTQRDAAPYARLCG
jgi:iron complex transport system substrate-binding protein